MNRDEQLDAIRAWFCARQLHHVTNATITRRVTVVNTICSAISAYLGAHRGGAR
ncbi:MAG TPA: hypothetical protein PLB01_00110 [Thermoanaerobaculia bacterium]|nr:hypothetical protein [Thermoanaerobaculia bacterium]